MSLELRRRLMATEPTDIIIDARKGGVSGDAANDAALMEVIYTQGWSKSPLYMTKREAEAVTDIGTFFSNHIDIVDLEAFGYFSSVKEVKWMAFVGLTYLKRISIPKSVISGSGLENMPTEYMYSLSVNSENPIYSSLDNVLYKNSTSIVLVPKSSGGEIVVREGVTALSSTSFQNCKKVERVFLPDSITTIGLRAFMNCESLQEINLPKKLTALNSIVFENCPNLTLPEFNLPEVKTASSGAYFGGRNNPPKRINNNRLYLPKVIGEIAIYIYGLGRGVIGYVYIGEGCTKIASINPYVATTIYVCMASTPPILSSLTVDRDVCGKELYVPRDAIQQYQDNEYWAGSFTDIYAVEDIDPNLLAYMKFETDIKPT